MLGQGKRQPRRKIKKCRPSFFYFSAAPARGENGEAPLLLTLRAHERDNYWSSDPTKPKETEGHRRRPNDTGHKTSEPGSRSTKPGLESAKPGSQSATPGFESSKPEHRRLRKGPWSHLGPKSPITSLFGLLFEGFLEGFQKAIFRLGKHRRLRGPAPEPRSLARTLRSLARTLRSPVRKPRSPDQHAEIAHARRSLASRRQAPITEIALFCRSLAPTSRSPVFSLRSLARRQRSPTATHEREVGLKSACGAVLGFGALLQNPRR